MIQSRNVKENCEVIVPSIWQSFFPKKGSFEVSKFHGATYVRPGHPSLRTQALCFNSALRTRRKQQPLPPMTRVLNTKTAPLVLQYVNTIRDTCVSDVTPQPDSQNCPPSFTARVFIPDFPLFLCFLLTLPL